MDSQITKIMSVDNQALDTIKQTEDAVSRLTEGGSKLNTLFKDMAASLKLISEELEKTFGEKKSEGPLTEGTLAYWEEEKRMAEEALKSMNLLTDRKDELSKATKRVQEASANVGKLDVSKAAAAAPAAAAAAPSFDEAVFKKLKIYYKDSGNDAVEAGDKAKKFLKGVKDNASLAGDGIGYVKKAFGGISKGADEVLGSVANVAEGFKGGLVGGIAAAAGEMTKYLSKLIGGNKKFQADQKLFLEDQRKAQEAYNLLLIQQIRLKKSGMEGTLYRDYLGEISRAVKAEEEAQIRLAEIGGKSREEQENSIKKQMRITSIHPFLTDEAKEELKKQGEERLNMLSGMTDMEAALNSIQIKTGVKKKKLLGMTTGSKDVYGSLLDNLSSDYQDLIGPEGTLNVGTAKLILQNEKLDEKGKRTLQSLISYTEEYEASLKQVRDVVGEIFGKLGDNIGNALVEALKQGEDGIDAFRKSFEDSVTAMVESLITNMAVSAFFKPILDKWGTELENSLTEYDDNPMETATEVKRIATGMIAAVNDRVPDAIVFMEEIKKMGYFKSEEEKKAADKSLSGAISTVTEETASVLAGQMNAMRITQVDSLDLSRQSVTVLRDSLMYHAETARNTGYLIELTALVRDMSGTGAIATDSMRAKGI